MRIFLDANVLFSAAKSDGVVRQLLTLLEKSGHECCVDGYVIEEARRNLVAKAPDGVVALERLLSRLKTAGAQRSDAALEASLPLPAKDRPYWRRLFTRVVSLGHWRPHALRASVRPYDS